MGRKIVRSLRWVTFLVVAGCAIAALLGLAPPARAAATVVVDDGVLTGTNRFTYTGNSWTTCGGCNTGALGNSFRYANTPGDSATLTFTGTAATLTGYNEPTGGIATVSVDRGPTTDINLYNPTTRLTPIYTSPTLTNGTHTITITVTGRRATGATAAAITIDKADVAGSGGTAPTTASTPTTVTSAPTTTKPPTTSTGPVSVPQTSTPTTTSSTPPAVSTAMASITFDDGTAGHYTYARPGLAQRGLKGTFYIVSDALTWGLASNLNASQVKALAADGNEIGNHTRDHSNLSALSSADVTREFADSQAAIQSQIGTRPTTCAYPYGSHNAGVDAIAAQYFRGCRETGGGLNSLAGLRPYALVNYYVTASTTAADVQAAIGRAKAANGWVIFTYHGIENGATGESVTPAAFAAQLDAIKSSGIAVRTVSAALTVYGR